MSKHTPWEIEWGKPIAIGDGVAFVPQSLDGTHTANAYLISQAPAMLEALEDLVALAEDAMRDANRDGGEYDIAELVRPVYAVIRAARGEA